MPNSSCNTDQSSRPGYAMPASATGARAIQYRSSGMHSSPIHVPVSVPGGTSFRLNSVREAFGVVLVGFVADVVGDQPVDVGIRLAQLVQDRPRVLADP